MGTTRNIPALMHANGGLTLSNQGTGSVIINFEKNGNGELTALLSFGGCSQALITFDANNRNPVSYSLFSPAPTVFVEQTVCNIMQQISGYIPSM